MLLPALSNAKEKARQTQCMNNLRQIGSGFFSYAEDYNGALPWGTDVGGTPENEKWFYYLTNLRYISDQVGTTGNGMVCPTYLAKPDVPAGSQGAYGYNFYLTTKKYTTYPYPTETQLLADSCDFGTATSGCVGCPCAYPDDFRFRHKSMANLFFLDGHAEARPRAKIWEWGQSYTPKSAAARFWGNEPYM